MSLKYWLWLSTRQGIGAARVKHLVDHFGSPDNIYYAGERDYLDINSIKPADIAQLMNKDLGKVNKILASCVEAGCRVVTFQDSDYPDRLRNIYDPPVVLYVKGNLPYVDDEPVVGVVGTRKCTPYGIKTAENVGYGLSGSGIIVVTGLARGVDTAATRGGLRGSSPVIGVIGSGHDFVFPSENKALYDDVKSHGAIISEYSPGTPAMQHHFPARNRIISGISLGVAVIEAPKRSGALITAARALEQGRDVFALPGNVDAAACEGSNGLLREGAIPFITADDIIDEYIELYPDKISKSKGELFMDTLPEDCLSGENESKKSFDNITKVDYIDLGNLPDKLDGDEKSIAEIIGLNSLQIDEIITGTGFSAQRVLAALTMLELNGYSMRDINGKWELII